jgi:hypothetical protein
MTTTFLRIPQQAAHTSLSLADDVDIQPPRAPSLLQQVSARLQALRASLPGAVPARALLLPPRCLMSWHHLREAVVLADGNKLHVYVFSTEGASVGASECASEGEGHWLAPIATPARPIKSVAWSPLSNTLVVGSNDGELHALLGLYLSFI